MDQNSENNRRRRSASASEAPAENATSSRRTPTQATTSSESVMTAPGFSSVRNAADKIQRETRRSNKTAPKAVLNLEQFRADYEAAQEREREEAIIRAAEKERKRQLELRRQQEEIAAQKREEELQRQREKEEEIARTLEIQRKREEREARIREEMIERARAAEAERLRKLEEERLRQEEEERVRNLMAEKLRKEQEEALRAELEAAEEMEKEHERFRQVEEALSIELGELPVAEEKTCMEDESDSGLSELPAAKEKSYIEDESDSELDEMLGSVHAEESQASDIEINLEDVLVDVAENSLEQRKVTVPESASIISSYERESANVSETDLNSADESNFENASESDFNSTDENNFENVSENGSIDANDSENYAETVSEEDSETSSGNTQKQPFAAAATLKKLKLQLHLPVKVKGMDRVVHRVKHEINKLDKDTIQPKAETHHKLFNRRKYDALLGKIIAFSMIGFMLLNVIVRDQKSSVVENRELRQFPKLSTSTLLDGSFTNSFEEYSSDQFAGRNAFRSLQIFLRWLTGSRLENDVYLGKDGQLLESIISPDQNLLSANIDAINHFVDANQNKRFIMMLVPDAGTVLTDAYPAYADKGNQRADYAHIREMLAPEFQWIDLTDTLSAHADEKIYYKTDHHWTSLGANYAYQAYCGVLGLNPGSFATKTVSTNFNGVLSSKSGFSMGVKESIEIYIPEIATEQVVTYVDEQRKTATLYDQDKLDTKDQYAVFMGGNYPLIDIKTTTGNGQVLLLFKDSFANSEIPFLATQYNEIIVVDPRYYYGDVNELMASYAVNDVLFLYSGNTFFTENNLQGILLDE